MSEYVTTWAVGRSDFDVTGPDGRVVLGGVSLATADVVAAALNAERGEAIGTQGVAAGAADAATEPSPCVAEATRPPAGDSGMVPRGSVRSLEDAFYEGYREASDQAERCYGMGENTAGDSLCARANAMLEAAAAVHDMLDATPARPDPVVPRQLRRTYGAVNDARAALYETLGEVERHLDVLRATLEYDAAGRL